MENYKPSYLKLSKSELEKRINQAIEMLEECCVCPRKCSVNRIENEQGFCHSGYLPIVSSYTKHFGEEPVLSGEKGVGNIFFGNCNLRCIYCQNFEISQNWKVEKLNQVTFERLADIMIELQNKDCHSIGLVSPTHFGPQIIKSIGIAIEKGLKLPIVYNSNGYDNVDTLKLFDGIIDIYLPDFKYGDNSLANEYSKANDYFEKAKASIKEMYRQVGDELVIENNLVVRGLIIRHLVLPNDLAETERVFEFIASELSPNVHISVMSQYFPTHKVNQNVLLDRKIRESEYEKVLDLLDYYGLENGWVQEYESTDYYRPHFSENRLEPFKL